MAAPFRDPTRVDARDTDAAGALYPVFLPPVEVPQAVVAGIVDDALGDVVELLRRAATGQ